MTTPDRHRMLCLAFLVFGWLGGCLWCADAATPASASDALAGALVQKAGIRVGVCELPRIGDGTLAAAFARQGIAQVHGLAPDTAALEAARAPSAVCNVLGSQVIIETGTPSAIPLGDWVADLLVVADASDANLQELPSAEARRVLAPYRGVAVVGQPKNGMGNLSRAALTTWAEAIGGTVSVREDESGLWAVVRMPALAGGDDWSHHMHGPDGNLVSNDTVFGTAPFELQWTNKPYSAGHWDIHVVSAGRMFSAQGSVYQRPEEPFEVVARSAFNGQVLWRRPIDQHFGESESVIIATPEKLYLKDKNRVLVLNAENGEEVNHIVAYKDESLQCLLILLSDGVLLTLTGPVQKYNGDAEDFNQSPAKLRAQDETNELYEGGELIAWDAESCKELWRFKDEKIDPSKVAITGGRVYLYANRTYAVALDLKSGAQIWKAKSPLADPKGPGMGYVSGHATVKTLSMYRDGAIATKDAYIITYLPHRHCEAFATADGRILWDKLNGPQGTDPKKAGDTINWLALTCPLVIGSKIFERDNWMHSSGAFDLMSGAMTKDDVRFNYGGCGRFTGTASGLLIGQSGEVCDVNTHKNILSLNAKSTCGSGQFVADGMLLKLASSCPGCSEWRGFFTGRSVPKHEVRVGKRLETGAAGAPALVANDDADWTTYRSDDSRKGSSRALVTATGTIRWTFTPQVRPFSLGDGGQYLLPDDNGTQAIAVGERIWFGTAQGAIVCLDRATGGEVWRHWTAGRIWTSPTWWQGRIYAGSCDGWVYCLDAGRGALAWRYRVSPEDRRVMILGRLSSAWPILSNVLVQEGTVYAVGGLVGQLGGSELCALDAKTGAVRWEKTYGISASGQIAWGEGRLWWHAGDAGVFIVDPATGAIQGVNGGGKWLNWGLSRGQEIGVLPGGWVAIGGRQFNLPPTARDQYATICGFLHAASEAPPHDVKDVQSATAVIRLDRSHSFDSIPVWDADETLLFGKYGGWQGGANTSSPTPLPPVLCRNLGAQLTAEAEARRLASSKPGGPTHQPEWFSTWEPQGEQRHVALPASYLNADFKSNSLIYGPVLGANAWVFCNRDMVYAMSRSASKELWRVKLPGAALANGLSLTRAGDVLVALLDGRVVCIGAPGVVPSAQPSTGAKNP